MEWWFYIPLVVWCLLVFATGLMVGSFINVLAARLPYEKSIVWPSSRCFACFQKVRTFDNVPILGYLRLGGKCRFCKAPFSSRYLWVEIGTGVAFLALFLAEVVFDWFKLPNVKFAILGPGGSPSWQAFAVFLFHAVLLSGLIASAVIDAEHRIIPTQITYTVMVVGIVGSTLMPWPWPHPTINAQIGLPTDRPWFLDEYVGKIPLGVQPWPFWGPLFTFTPEGSWQLGLLNAAIGALAGSLVVRATKWLFETGLGREALGLGDADLLMMTGAFLGWQIPVLGMFVGAIAALVLMLLMKAFQSTQSPAAATPTGTSVTGPPQARELPFGPGLAIGVVVTWFAWPWLGPKLQFPFFDGTTMGVLVAVMGLGLLAAALLLRGRAAPAAK